ncbi:GNAT family N-acetyltransferase [Natronomonas sp. CBA1123]|uniref:GNAT family N-acetyltransferase n=1 Tax=Natronomonas sp. CBA1123 TaxID=2668070 RepID=UPI0012EAA327|nr:GNAT family N-acetyltransferase [Natronomonas sp. CBA1123]MUV87962.1 GNAT family N-acetyltransferase [Natronomonas sp. CBA1123]
MSEPDVTVRQARHDDHEAVVEFTQDTWPELGGDYIPRVFEEWVDTDGQTQRTLVAVVDGDPVGICQGVILSEHEAWAQGMRVAPNYRGEGISPALTEAVFEWAADRGATICRNMVFSWNAAGLGQSRSMGFEPLAEFRWVEPDPEETADPTLDVLTDPTAAWSAFHGSDAYHELSGLGLDLEESWALAELTPDRLADAEATLTVADDGGVRGTTYRVRTFEREEDGEEKQWAEYGVGAWDDHEALRSLAAAVARDAAEVGAEKARMLVPETPRHVSDAAYARQSISEEPDFVLERDLTRY